MVETAARTYRTREDKFADDWTSVESMLKKEPGLQSQTLMQWLIDQNEQKYNWGQLRTLQRQIRKWRALQGPDKEVMFPQEHIPGKQSQSDWTHANSLGVTICGQPFPHTFFHFMLPYSKWETAHLSHSESLENLTMGYMRAVAELGAAPKEHRTDNLTAAVKSHGNSHVFNERWKDFLRHYDVSPSKNNAGVSHENGSVEKSHDLFKNALDQQLKLRGSSDFASVAEYEKFVRRILDQRNKGRKQRLAEEMAVMNELPEHDWNDPTEVTPTVTSFSTISVARAIYSVPARLIGRELKALVYPEVVRVFLGNTLVQEMPRLQPGSKKINYRHMIAQLVRKPGAFANYRYRDELFPSLVFRQAYDALAEKRPEQADKDYLAILNLAAMSSEQDVETGIATLLAGGQLPLLAAVKELIQDRIPDELPPVHIPAPDLSSYDELLTYQMRALKETPS